MMTKKEIAAHAEELAKKDAEIERLLLRAALSWSPAVEPDIPPPDWSLKNLTQGFLFRTYSSVVKPACSSCVGHS